MRLNLMGRFLAIKLRMLENGTYWWSMMINQQTLLATYGEDIYLLLDLDLELLT